MTGGLVLFLSLGMLAFALDFLVAAHDLAAGLPLLAAGLYGAWQVLTAPVSISISRDSIQTRGLRPASLRPADIERVDFAGSWRGERLRLLRRDATIALELDAGQFDRARLLDALSRAGVRPVRPRH